MKILSDFKVKIEQQVNWNDMDVLGHVNNTRYFVYLEASRIEYIRRVGFYRYFESNGLAPVLARVSCNFMVPLQFPDTIEIGTRVRQIVNDTIYMEHYISSKSNGLSAIAESELVVYDFNENRKIDIPDHLRWSIEGLEGNCKGGRNDKKQCYS